MLLFETSGDESFLFQFISSFQSWSHKGLSAFFATLVSGLLIVLVLKLLTIWLEAVLKKIFSRSKTINALMANFLLKIINIICWILIAVWFLQHMGINIGPVLTGLGVTGVILGLAFQETLGNLLSGVMIVINAPFRIGDYIDSGSLSGTVTDMDLICVSLATPDNKSITMSNKLVWGNPIVNYSNMDKRRVDMTTSVAYGTDISQVKTLLMQMLASYPEVLPNPQPVVEVSKCADSSIDFMVCPWVKPQDYWTVKWRFQSEEYDKLNAAGIEIPFNQLDVHIRTDGES